MTRRAMNGHPDFEAAPERRRYAGQLYGLFTFLSFESERAHPGTDCWRILPGGAVVSMKRKENGKRIIRISRSERFKTADGPKLWEQEVWTFIEKFRVTRWYRVDDTAAQGVAVFLHEEEPGVHCACGALIDPGLLPLATCCADCATAEVRGKVGAQ